MLFFERIGADGAYKARTEPVFITPARKPKNGQLTDEQKEENRVKSSGRVIVENIFSRVKGYGCMRKWRCERGRHEWAAQLVFELVQVAHLCF